MLFLLNEVVVLGRQPHLQLLKSKIFAGLPKFSGIQKGILIRVLYATGLIGSQSKSPVTISLTGADLTGAILSGAILPGIQLGGADLTNADLSYANVAGGDLYSATCKNVNFQGADLTDVNFSHYEIVADNLDIKLLNSLGARGVRPD